MRASIGQAFAKNKVRLIVFGVFAVLTLFCALLPSAQTNLPLLLTGTVICAAVCVIGAIITCAIAYGRTVCADLPAGNERNLLVTRTLACFLLCALVLTVTVVCLAATLYSFSRMPGTDDAQLFSEIESLYGKDMADNLRSQIEATDTFFATAAARGYFSPAFLACLFVSCMLTLLCFLIKFFSALSFARAWNGHPILSSIFGFTCLDLFESFLISALTALTLVAAPGLGRVSAQFSALISVNTENIVTALNHMTATLPWAADYIKLSVFSALCTLLAAISCALVGTTVLKRTGTHKQV